MRLSEFEYQAVLDRLNGKTAHKSVRGPESQGFVDYWNKGIGGKNPYPVGSKEAHQWYKGWLSAKEEDQEASR